MNKILIVGAGPSGLVSGFYLSKKGLHITIVEETDQIGGLLKTVRIDGIDIEAVYHHILFNDYELRELIESLSLSKSLEWHTSSIALFTNKRYYNISTPFNYLFLDFLSILQRLRLIKNLAFPRLDINSLRELFGDEVFEQFIKDMLINKFGIYSDIINPKWFVNKLKKRGRSRYIICERLGYLNGSFKIFCEKIKKQITDYRGEILTGSSVENIYKKDNGFVVSIDGRDFYFDEIIFTISPSKIADMVSDIDAEFASQLRQLQYMSNITILLYTRKNLANYYWVNIADREVRLTGIISQSNLVRYPSAKGFFTYVSIYLPRDDKLLMVDSSQMLKFILQELCKMDISLKESEIFEFYVTRTEYAQPIYIADNDLVLSSLVTPISGIYVLNNHSILPEDRGLNNIVCKAKILSNLIPRAH